MFLGRRYTPYVYIYIYIYPPLFIVHMARASPQSWKLKAFADPVSLGCQPGARHVRIPFINEPPERSPPSRASSPPTGTPPLTTRNHLASDPKFAHEKAQKLSPQSDQKQWQNRENASFEQVLDKASQEMSKHSGSLYRNLNIYMNAVQFLMSTAFNKFTNMTSKCIKKWAKIDARGFKSCIPKIH